MDSHELRTHLICSSPSVFCRIKPASLDVSYPRNGFLTSIHMPDQLRHAITELQQASHWKGDENLRS